MLGRYIAGTLLLLGAAMIAAPESPPKDAEVAVARTETTPAALATADPTAMAKAVRVAADAVAPPPVAVSTEDAVAPPPVTVSTERAAEPGETLQASVEAALAEALAIDTAENGVATIGTAENEAEAPFEAELNGVTMNFDVVAAEPQVGVAPGSIRAEPTFAEPGPRRLFVTGNRVNVRAGPSTLYEVVGSLAYGDAVELVSFEGQDWARIRIGGGDTIGYMSRKFLSKELADG